MWPFSRYISVSSKGILQGMTDCHSHLLPGVDDGVRTAEESLRILEEMEQLNPHAASSLWNAMSHIQPTYLPPAIEKRQ